MNIDRPVLNRSMMEQYEIKEHHPAKIQAVLFGMDELMLGGIARALDHNGVGALCVSEKAAIMNSQDCMYTVLVRGGNLAKTREEVVQSVLSAVDPEKDFDEMLEYAGRDGIEMIFCHECASTVEYGLALRFIAEMYKLGKKLPILYVASDLPGTDSAAIAGKLLAGIAERWGSGELVSKIEIVPLIVEGLFGILPEREAERQQSVMNYSDKLLMWAYPEVRLLSEKADCAAVTAVECIINEITLCEKMDHTLEFMCAAAGYLYGESTFAGVMANDDLRKWIAHAWFDELYPQVKTDTVLRERTIRAFERYEDNHNDVPLLSARDLGARFPRTLLKGIRSYAEDNFEAPRLSVLAFSAMIMLYSGVRKGLSGYEVYRGEESSILKDRGEVLEAFSCLSHDMPAESLTYAVLADRNLWGEDLREIDGLEMAVMSDISSIQRIGFRETLRNRLEEVK